MTVAPVSPRTTIGGSAAGVLLLVLVAAFPWDDALAFPSEKVSVIKLLGVVLGAAYLLRALTRGAELRLPWTVAAAGGFVALMLLSLLVSGDAAAGVNRALRYLLFAGFVFLFVQLVRTRGQVVLVLRVLVGSATAAAGVGLVAFLSGSEGRVAGPIGEANDFAFLLGATLPLAIHLAVAERSRRWLWSACAAVLALAIVGTLSRGEFVGLAALAVWAVAARRVPLKPVLIGVGIAVIAAAAAFLLWRGFIVERYEAKQKVSEANVQSRKAYWSAAVRIAADHPLLGVGPGRFGIVGDEGYIRDDPLHVRRPVAHNSYLEVLAEGGFPALIAFLAFIGGSWWLVGTARREALTDGDREGAQLASAVQASLIVTIVSASFLSVQVAAPFWLLGGLATALAYGVSGRERATGLPLPRPKLLLVRG